MSISWDPRSWFAPTKTTDTTSNMSGTSTTSGATNVAGTTTGAVDPRYGYQVGNTVNNLPGIWNPAQALATQSAAPVTANDIGALRDPTVAMQFAAAKAMLDPSNQDALSQLRGGMSSNPYGSSNSGAEARLRGQQSAVLGNLAGTLTQQGWAPAAGVAQGNQASLARASQTLGGLGAQQAGATGTLVNAGGQTTSGATNQNQTTNQTTATTGQQTGHSEVSDNPSPFQTVTAFGKMALPFLRDGGSVSGYASGGEVGSKERSFADRVEAAFHSFHRMRKHAQDGGTIDRRGFADGGYEPPYVPWNEAGPGEENIADPNAWGATVTSAPQQQGRSWADKLSQGLGDASSSIYGQRQPAAASTQPQQPRSSLDDAQSMLRQFWASMQQRPAAADGGRFGYADGEVVTADGPLGALSSVGSGIADYGRGILDRMNDYAGGTGRYQSLSNFLGDASGPNIFGRAEEGRRSQQQIDAHEAQLLGKFPRGPNAGQMTLAGIAQPYDLYHKWAVASAADPDTTARILELQERAARNDMPTAEELRRALTPPIPRPTFPTVPGSVSGSGSSPTGTPGVSGAPTAPTPSLSPALRAASDAPPPSGSGDFLDGLKQREGGFQSKPFSDGSRQSIGYGTKALPGDERGITEEEGARRMQIAEAGARKSVRDWAGANGVAMSQPQEDAMTDLTYRGGPAWQRGPLGAALKAGNLDEARKQYEGYNVNVRDPSTGALAPSQGILSRNQQMSQLLTNAGSAGAGPAPQQAPSLASQAASLVERGVLSEADPAVAASNYFQLRQNPQIGAAIKDTIDKAGIKIPEGDWRAEARAFVQATRANPQGVPNRTYPSSSVPQGGDPNAPNAIAPYAPETRKTNRPTLSDEDRRNMFLRQINGLLKGRGLGTSLEHTPGYMYEQEQAKLRAKRDIEMEDKQKAGRKIEDAFDKMHDALVEAGPDVVNAATGPYLGDPNAPWRDRLSLLPSEVRKKAQALGVEMDHFVDRVANAQGGGDKAATDQARTEMKNIVGHAFKSTSLEGVFKVLHDAKNASQDKMELPSDPVQKTYLPQQWVPDKERIPPPNGHPKARLGNDNIWYDRTREGRWLPIGRYAPPEGELRAQPSNAPDQVPPPARKLGAADLEGKGLGDVVKIGGVPHELTARGWVARPQTAERSQEENLRRAAMTPIERAAENRARAAEARTAAPAQPTQNPADVQAAFAKDAAAMAPLELAQRYDAVRSLLTPEQLRVLNAAIEQAVPMPGRR